MRRLMLAVLALAASGANGCVERTLQIRSNPSKARVFLDEKEIGETPLTLRFHFYRTSQIRLVKDGYLTHRGDVALSAPWYEWFPLDFFSEILLPFTIHDRHQYVAALEPRPTGKQAEAEEAAFLKRADAARNSGDLEPKK